MVLSFNPSIFKSLFALVLTQQFKQKLEYLAQQGLNVQSLRKQRPDIIRENLNAFKLCNFKTNQLVIKENQTFEHIFILIRGQVQIQKNIDKQLMNLTSIGHGESLGVYEVLKNQPSNHTIVSKQISQFFKMEQQFFKSLQPFDIFQSIFLDRAALCNLSLTQKIDKEQHHISKLNQSQGIFQQKKSIKLFNGHLNVKKNKKVHSKLYFYLKNVEDVLEKEPQEFNVQKFFMKGSMTSDAYERIVKIKVMQEKQSKILEKNASSKNDSFQSQLGRSFLLKQIIQQKIKNQLKFKNKSRYNPINYHLPKINPTHQQAQTHRLLPDEYKKSYKIY